MPLKELDVPLMERSGPRKKVNVLVKVRVLCIGEREGRRDGGRGGEDGGGEEEVRERRGRGQRRREESLKILLLSLRAFFSPPPFYPPPPRTHTLFPTHTVPHTHCSPHTLFPPTHTFPTHTFPTHIPSTASITNTAHFAHTRSHSLRSYVCSCLLRVRSLDWL